MLGERKSLGVLSSAKARARNAGKVASKRGQARVGEKVLARHAGMLHASPAEAVVGNTASWNARRRLGKIAVSLTLAEGNRTYAGEKVWYSWA